MGGPDIMEAGVRGKTHIQRHFRQRPSCRDPLPLPVPVSLFPGSRDRPKLVDRARSQVHSLRLLS